MTQRTTTEAAASGMPWDDAMREACRPYFGQRARWGTLDCMQMLRAYWRLRTGEDVAADLKYEDWNGAKAILARYGGFSGLVSSVIDRQPSVRPPRLGDVCTVDLTAGQDDTGELLSGGIFAGYCVFCFNPNEGLARCSVSQILDSWEV